MSRRTQIEAELQIYLENDRRQHISERIESLMAIFDKYLGMDTKEVELSYKDLVHIVGVAKTNSANQLTPILIGDRTVGRNDEPHVAMIDSVVSFLNGKELLKQLPKFEVKK